MKSVFSAGFPDHEVFRQFIRDFDAHPEVLVRGKRNTIKIFDYQDRRFAVKSFRTPNLLNAFIYGFIRKSKARRSFEFAEKLLSLGIGTPAPIAYFEHTTFGFLGRSFYCSEFLFPDLTFKNLVSEPDFPEHDTILRAFTKFSFLLHEKGVEFLDHTPGNTLIKKSGRGHWDFFLVDLNRMVFRSELSFDERMKNLSRLTPKKEMVEVMADEYASLYDKPRDIVFKKLWDYTRRFQDAFRRKRELKRKLKFGRK